MPPPKPPLTAVSEPDPIYPYLPFLFCFSSLAMTVPILLAGHRDASISVFAGNYRVEKLGVCAEPDTRLAKPYIFHTNPTVQTNYNRSLMEAL